jgi:hypothetical protein
MGDAALREPACACGAPGGAVVAGTAPRRGDAGAQARRKSPRAEAGGAGLATPAGAAGAATRGTGCVVAGRGAVLAGGPARPRPGVRQLGEQDSSMCRVLPTAWVSQESPVASPASCRARAGEVRAQPRVGRTTARDRRTLVSEPSSRRSLRRGRRLRPPHLQMGLPRRRVRCRLQQRCARLVTRRADCLACSVPRRVGLDTVAFDEGRYVIARRV